MPYEIINDRMLNDLRAKVEGALSAERFVHTCGVEKTAINMTEIYAPELVDKMRAAALLHDITKEYSLEKQLKICSDFGIILRDDERYAPVILHAITAAAIIPSEYADFACSDIIGAVRWHTTGHASMTLPEKLLCLADYIEDGRKYADCARAREKFWGARPAEMNDTARVRHLDNILVMSFESTIAHIRAKGGVVNADTLIARKQLTNQ